MTGFGARKTSGSRRLIFCNRCPISGSKRTRLRGGGRDFLAAVGVAGLR